MTLSELVKKTGLSRNTIENYETGKSRPRETEIYIRLAKGLNVGTHELLTEEEAFLEEVRNKYGNRSKTQARGLMERSAALFAGGSPDQEDKSAFLFEIRQLYLESKENAKKYMPKKHRKAE